MSAPFVSSPDPSAACVETVETEEASTPGWSLTELEGRLVELSGDGASCAMSFAMLLVRDAQARGEPVAWVTSERRTFYPPDAFRMGVDLRSLVVVRTRDLGDALRAADGLLRSGSLGLCVVDTGSDRLPLSLSSRLAGLARHHVTAALCLTEKSSCAASLGPLVSLRLHATRGSVDVDGEVCCRLDVIKDRRRGGRWSHEEVFRAPDGLC